MLINASIRIYLLRLDDIYRTSRRQYPDNMPLCLHQITVGFLQYWREIETTVFPNIPQDHQDEIFYHFNKKLLEIVTAHLDMYWLIYDHDGQHIYKTGRDVPCFWRKPKPDIIRGEVSFPQALRDRRRDRRLTQRDLGKALRVSRTTIAHFEKGRCTPTLPHLYSLLKRLDISSGELLGI